MTFQAGQGGSQRNTVVGSQAGRFDLQSCTTYSYSMRDTLTISLPENTKQLVERAAREGGMTTSEFVRLAIFHELWKDATVESRRLALPVARSRGIFTDEDVFRLIS